MKTKIKVSPTIVLMAISSVVFKDISLLKSAVVLSAALLHEMGHLLIALTLNIPLKCIQLDVFGASIEVECSSCSYVKEAILCLAGPLANILSALVVSRIFLPFDTRLFTVASALLAIINLLPAKGFDGGRILSCFLLSFLSPRAVSLITELSSFVCVFLLWSASVYFIMRTGSYVSLFIFSGALFARLFLSNEDFRE